LFRSGGTAQKAIGTAGMEFDVTHAEEAPNSKFQIPKKLPTPNLKPEMLGNSSAI